MDVEIAGGGGEEDEGEEERLFQMGLFCVEAETASLSKYWLSLQNAILEPAANARFLFWLAFYNLNINKPLVQGVSDPQHLNLLAC